ncbi:MAG TPA: hypothetical protein VGR57_07455 [Ktedonobacterales bacterium]|nr:hypothetical protein [Ktedonobacterales bacterium]
MFSPPHGYAVVNGARYYAATVTTNLLFLSPSDPLVFMKSALHTLIVSNLFFDLPVVLFNNERVIAGLTHPITAAIFGGVKGLATAVQVVGVLTLGYLSALTGRLTLTDLIRLSPSEAYAEQFYHFSFGPGFFILLAGFAIALVIVARNVGPWVGAALALVVVALFCTGHLAVLTNIFELLDRINPLHYVGL